VLHGQTEAYIVVVIFRCCMAKQKYTLWWLYLGAAWPNRSIYSGGYIEVLHGQTEVYIVVVIFRCCMAKQKYILWCLYLGVAWPNRSIHCGSYI